MRRRSQRTTMTMRRSVQHRRAWQRAACTLTLTCSCVAQGDLQAWQQHVFLAGCTLIESYDKVGVHSSQLQVCRPGSLQLQHFACLTA